MEGERVPLFLSKTLVNWLIAGGTLRRILRTAFWRWSLMYSGHLTKRERSRFGWRSFPMPKFLGVFSINGFDGAAAVFGLAAIFGVGATFFPFAYC